MAERSAHLLLILIILSVLTIASDPAKKAPAPGPPQKFANSGPAVLEPKQILNRESPAIVTVFSVDKSGKPFMFGSGFVVRPNGIIVTNYHVVKGAYDAKVKLKTGEIYENVLVLDYDTRRDVVLLKIRALNLPTVTLGDSTVIEPGDRAYAIGNPEGYDYTISDGLISARRIIEGTEELQMTVPISHGSSGGPLYNVYGQVIGVTTSGYMEGGAQNLNFALPIKYVVAMLDSPARNMTLAQLTAQISPNETANAEHARAPETAGAGSRSSNSYLDPSGWMELPVLPGWQVEDPPPKDMMAYISKGNSAMLVAIRMENARDADDAFVIAKAAAAKIYGRLSEYSKTKLTYDGQDGRRMRMQSFSSNYKGVEQIVLVGTLQRGDRIMGIMGICVPEEYDDLVAVAGDIKW